MKIKNFILILAFIWLFISLFSLNSAIKEYNELNKLDTLKQNSFICLDLRYNNLDNYTIIEDKILFNNQNYSITELKQSCNIQK